MKYQVLIALFTFSFAIAQTPEKTEKTTIIESTYYNITDDVQSYPEKVSLSQPRVAVDINHNLQKLPGATVTQFSGPGSQSGIISPIATGSGGTQVTVDDIPVISGFGRVPDLTYFPPAFFKRMDWYSPFYPWAEGRTSPGGRLDLVSRTVDLEEIDATAAALYGTANTAQLSTSVSDRSGKHAWYLGITGFRTDGNYNYVDPRDLSQQTRTNNDSRYVGLLLKDKISFSEKTTLDLLALGQLGHRTDPSSIVSPFSNPGHDVFFGQASARLSQVDFVDGMTGKFLATHNVDRNYYTNFSTITFGSGPPTITTGLSGPEFSQGDFFSFNLSGQKKRHSAFSQVDVLYEKVEAYYPLNTDRQTVGITLGVDAIRLSEKDFLLPRIRSEFISTYSSGPQLDGGLSYIHEFEPGKEIFAGVNSLHKTPSMIALYGYLEGGFPIRGLATLPIERMEVYSLGYNVVQKTHGFWITGWYSHHAGMALRSSTSFVQVNDAQTYGVTAQLTCQFFDRWNAQVSGSLEKTRNNDLGTELTFKPPYILSAGLSYEFSPGTTLGVEDTYQGTRYFSSSNVSAFPNGSSEPINWAHVKGTVALGPGSLYLKVSNVFDAAGFDNPGYPYPGRSYWVGYSL